MEFSEVIENAFLQNVVAPTEIKFNKYFQNFSYLFYSRAIMDPYCKIARLEFLIQEFHTSMDYDSIF